MSEIPACLAEGWIYSKNNRKLSLANYSVDDVDIDEIAHALANTCRFGGHCSSFYSVAEHCVIMANLVEEEFTSHPEYSKPRRLLPLAALLHDASEYMLTDVPKPFKFLMPEFEKYERLIMDVIEIKFGINTRHPFIKELDKRMVISEANELFDEPEWTKTWPHPHIPDFAKKHLACFDPEAAYFAFMDKYRELTQ